jgi:hypothetical protein
MIFVCYYSLLPYLSIFFFLRCSLLPRSPHMLPLRVFAFRPVPPSTSAGAARPRTEPLRWFALLIYPCRSSSAGSPSSAVPCLTSFIRSLSLRYAAILSLGSLPSELSWTHSPGAPFAPLSDPRPSPTPPRTRRHPRCSLPCRPRRSSPSVSTSSRSA